MKEYDVCMGASSRGPANVLVTTTEENAAAEITEVLNRHLGALFQCEGLKAFYRPVNRSGMVVRIEEPTVSDDPITADPEPGLFEEPDVIPETPKRHRRV